MLFLSCFFSSSFFFQPLLFPFSSASPPPSSLDFSSSLGYSTEFMFQIHLLTFLDLALTLLTNGTQLVQHTSLLLQDKPGKLTQL